MLCRNYDRFDIITAVTVKSSCDLTMYKPAEAHRRFRGTNCLQTSQLVVSCSIFAYHIFNPEDADSTLLGNVSEFLSGYTVSRLERYQSYSSELFYCNIGNTISPS